MFLPTATPSAPSEKEPKNDGLHFATNLNNLSLFGTCFSAGLVITLLPRLVPGGWIIYPFLKGSAIAYLWMSIDGNFKGFKLKKLAILAMLMSGIAGAWDAMWLLLSIPCQIYFLTMPVWIWLLIAVIGLGIASLLLWQGVN